MSYGRLDGCDWMTGVNLLDKSPEAQAVIWTGEICFQSELRHAEMTEANVQRTAAAGRPRVGSTRTELHGTDRYRSIAAC